MKKQLTMLALALFASNMSAAIIPIGDLTQSTVDLKKDLYKIFDDGVSLPTNKVDQEFAAIKDPKFGLALASKWDKVIAKLKDVAYDNVNKLNDEKVILSLGAILDSLQRSVYDEPKLILVPKFGPEPKGLSSIKEFFTKDIYDYIDDISDKYETKKASEVKPTLENKYLALPLDIRSNLVTPITLAKPTEGGKKTVIVLAKSVDKILDYAKKWLGIQ